MNCYGFILDDNSEYEKAIKVFAKALAIKSTFSPLPNNIGLSHAKLKNYEKAEIHFKAAIKIDNNSDAIRNLSMLFLDQLLYFITKKI